MAFGIMKGLKARLVSIVLLAMLPVLFLALFMAFDDYQTARNGALEHGRRLTGVYAATGRALIDRTCLLMEQASQLPGVQYYDPSSCGQIMTSLGSQRTITRSVGIYKANGQRLCSSGSISGPVSAAKADWFRMAVASRNFAIGHYQNGSDGGGGLPLGLPLVDGDGEIRFVLSLILDLGSLQDVLDDHDLPDNASASVIDGGGTILARFPAVTGAVGAQAPESHTFLPELLAHGQDTWESIGVDGVSRIYFLSHLVGQGDLALYLRVGLPAHTVFATAKRNLLRNLVFIGLMAAVVLTASWFFSNALVLRHITKLWLATGKLREGNYGYRIGSNAGGELGELAMAFDQMAGALEDHTEQLSNAERKYRDIFENSVAGIFRATPDGRIREANRAMALLLGYGEPKELMERVTDIGRQLYCEPNKRQELMERLNREGSVSCVEFPAKHADGTCLWLSMEARAIHSPDGEVTFYEGMVSDITSRKEMEQELRAKQEKLQALLDYTPALICIKDSAGRYLLANRKHEEVRNGGRRIMGKTVAEVFPPDLARDINLEDSLVLEEGQARTYQRIISNEDGARHYMTVKFPLYGDGGQPDRVGSISYDVTDLERVREALRQSEEKFRIMIQTSPDLIWLIDPQGVLVEVNSASRELIGYEPEELRGKHFHLFFHPEDLREHDRDLVLPLFQGRSPATGMHPKLINERRQMPRSTRNLNLRLVAKGSDQPDNVYRSFELSACGLWQDMCFRGTIVVIRDITERRRAEMALQESRELLTQTQRMARIGGWTLNLDTGAGSWTEEAALLLGTPGEAMPDILHNLEFLAEQDRETLRAALQCADKSGKPFDLELRLAHGSGLQPWVRVMARRADAEGGRLLSGVIQDITDRKELERLRADIDSIIRHDLKTPLNGIINLPQLMVTAENLTPSQVEFLRYIEESGRKMLRQIDMSLDLMKIELGQYASAPDTCDLVPICREVAYLLRETVRAKRLSLELTFEGRPLTEADSLPFWGEERLCLPLLSNLLVNALEASPEGETVSIRLERGEWVRVAIHNKGAVPEALRTRFFEKYATSGKNTGTGLGTYSALLFAKAQHGWLELITSEPGATTLVVSLPVPLDVG